MLTDAGPRSIEHALEIAKGGLCKVLNTLRKIGLGGIDDIIHTTFAGCLTKF